MGVRYLAAWIVVPLSLGGCGGTSKEPQPKPAQEPSCGESECPVECQALARFCFERQIWECETDGKTARLIQTCANHEACTETGDTAACEGDCQGDDCEPAPACMPKAQECRDGDIYECAADGSGFVLYRDCDAAQFEVCDAATLACVSSCPGDPACPEPACKLGERLCMQNDVYVCNELGTQLVFKEACGQFAHCFEEAAGVAYCVQNGCVPSQSFCHENQVKVCADDGTIPEEGTACGDEICDSGACHPKICEPFVNFCLDGDVHACGGLGIASQVSKSCPDSAPCAEVNAEHLDCRALPCEPGSTACVGNAIGSCADDGLGLSQVTTNCAASNQVCSTTPTCAASVVDLAGVAEEVELASSDTLLGNVIDVHTDRLLTKLEVNLLLETPRDLRFVVYAQKTQQYEAICSEITTNNLGSGFFGTSNLSCALEAGTRYLIGVGLVVGEGYHYFDEVPNSGTLSFGTALGSSYNGFAPTMFFDLANANLYQQRLTTELP